ncbi:MAG: two-component regulator propeller domain-containing protein [Bacteroidota bacterium]
MRFFVVPLLLVELMSGSAVLAQQYSPVTQAFSYEDGLGGEAVNAIVQDRYGFIWVGAFSGLHRFDGHDFISFPANVLDSCALSNNVVTDLLEDADGQLWVATKSGLNRLNRRDGCFDRWFHDPLRPGSLPDNDITHLWLDKQARLCLSTPNQLVAFDARNNQFTELDIKGPVYASLHLDSDEMLLAGREGLTIQQSDNSLREIPFANRDLQSPIHDVLIKGDTIWAATERGLFYVLPGDSSLSRAYDNGHPLHDLFLLSLQFYEGHIWIASRGAGIFTINGRGEIADEFVVDQSQPFSISDMHSRVFCADQQGNLWVGHYSGIDRFLTQGRPFTLYKSRQSPNKSSSTLEMAVTSDHRVIFYDRWTGLMRSNAIGEMAVRLDFPPNEYWVGRDLGNIYVDRSGMVWLPRSYDGVYRYQPATNQVLPPIQSDRISAAGLNDIIQDPVSDHIYWLATSDGLCRYNAITSAMDWYDPSNGPNGLDGPLIIALEAESNGRIWMAGGSYYNARIGYFDPGDDQFRFFDYELGNEEKAGGGRVKQLAFDDEGTLWVAAGQGLIEIAPDQFQVKLHTQLGGEKIGVLESIVISHDGQLWLAASDYLIRYDPQTERSRRFQCSAIEQFTNSNAAAGSDGALYFGGKNGIIAFHPDEILETPQFPPLILDELLVNGELYSGPSIPAETQEITLAPDEQLLTLKFVGLSFESTRPIQYAYKLSGIQREWQSLGEQRSLSFSKLKPGSYELNLRTDDGEGNWNPASRRIRIMVQPAWHQTWMATICFWLLGIAVLGGMIFLFFRRRLERREREHLLALDQLKTRFYTNLTHEFRTPLTLLLGPANRIKKRSQELSDTLLEKEADRIDTQGRRLLGLVNNLLEVRSLELGQKQVNLEPTLVTGFLTQIAEAFRRQVEEQGGRLVIETNWPNEKPIEVDREKMTSILVNLLDNARKYGPEDGQITLRID